MTNTKKIYCLLALVAAATLGGCAGQSKAVTRAGHVFEYAEVYLPEHGSEEYKALGLQNLDDEWGLWGHNLEKILPENPTVTIFARDANGVTRREQYCFSSDRLYSYICDYIDSKYDASESVRFAILPNDNAVVCNCSVCVAAGNTSSDATPAVMNMIKRLAAHYPNHTFFTSHYATTSTVPSQRMPENTGVLISAIDYPLTSVSGKAENDFALLLSRWKGVTDKVYVWDYVNNFDDYFTPYPVLTAMQRRLRLYRDMGVRGVFFNGSGYDYSSLSRLKTHLLSAMLDNPDIDWREELYKKSKELYPVNGKLIADFMAAQEDYVASKGKELPLYEGISKAIDTYLPVDRFVIFQDLLTQNLDFTNGNEKKELSVLDKALQMTRLELMRRNGNVAGYQQRLNKLTSIEDEDVRVYSETYWTIHSYVRDYKYLANKAEIDVATNKLKGAELTRFSGLDPQYSDLSVLTDGLLGMPSNYHNGIVVASPEGRWNIGVPNVGANKLRVWLVYNPSLKIDLPTEVRLFSGDNFVAKAVPDVPADRSGHTCVEFDIPGWVGKLLTLTFYADDNVRTIAFDEIEAF